MGFRHSRFWGSGLMVESLLNLLTILLLLLLWLSLLKLTRLRILRCYNYKHLRTRRPTSSELPKGNIPKSGVTVAMLFIRIYITVSVYIYIYICIATYIHTYVHTYLLTYISIHAIWANERLNESIHKQLVSQCLNMYIYIYTTEDRICPASAEYPQIPCSHRLDLPGACGVAPKIL